MDPHRSEVSGTASRRGASMCRLCWWKGYPLRCGGRSRSRFLGRTNLLLSGIPRFVCRRTPVDPWFLRELSRCHSHLLRYPSGRHGRPLLRRNHGSPRTHTPGCCLPAEAPSPLLSPLDSLVGPHWNSHLRPLVPSSPSVSLPTAGWPEVYGSMEELRILGL